MPLEIDIQRSPGAQHDVVVTVKLAGNLDSETAPALERELTKVFSGPVKDLVFDLAALKFISSAGLRVFAATRQTLKDQDGQAFVVNMQPQIREVFAIVKRLPGLALFRDVAELDHYLATRQRAHGSNGPAGQ